MKSPLTLALCFAGFCASLSSASLCADDWKTSDGKVYQNVTVVKAEPDAVTILHQNGGALVPLTTLPPELQKKFNYDPVAAKTAAEIRAQAKAENDKALQAEINQALRLKQAQLLAEDPKTPTPDPTPLPANVSTFDDSLTSGPTGPTHHSMSDLVDLNLRLRDDHPDSNHHSTGSLLSSARDLGPDTSDPNRHTMGEMAASGASLSTPTPDPTHHSMGQLFGTDPLK